MPLVTLKLPAGMRTTVLAGAELMAALMLAEVTVPPFNVLQAVVTQFDQVPLGMPPTTPALLQSAARLGLMTPDQF